MRVLIVGVPDATHVGGHFLEAGRQLGVEVELLSVAAAYQAPRLVRSLLWHAFGHRPARLGAFSSTLVGKCEAMKPDLVVATGLAPVNAEALLRIKQMGITTANFLTDDPWNKAHTAPWFMKGLKHYHQVFTPRHANEPELCALASPQIVYMPFGYAPEAHFPSAEPGLAERARASSNVLFIGGADQERTLIMNALQGRGFNLSLWGGYWDQRPGLKAFAHGHADLETFRREVVSNAINLCLVRRANRDGHSMRTFELAAVGGCMLVEDTEDHRSLFGDDGECVRYFTTMDELDQQAKALLKNPDERQHLAEAVHRRICKEGQHTYADRLRAISSHTHS